MGLGVRRRCRRARQGAGRVARRSHDLRRRGMRMGMERRRLTRGGGGEAGDKRGRGRANGVDSRKRTDGVDSPKAE
jgi:hypothetical protein